MKTAFRNILFLQYKWLATALVLSISFSLAAQPSSNSVDAQREAMHKLAFLAGRWSGPVTIVRGPAGALHLTQTEDVEFKLDGLVLLVQGQSVSADGKARFQALATVSFDDATRNYRFRAYHEGHYLDTELSVTGNGFSWGYTAGPVHIVNTMHLTAKGEWSEITEAAFGGHPPQRSVDMLLRHQP